VSELPLPLTGTETLDSALSQINLRCPNYLYPSRGRKPPLPRIPTTSPW